MKKIKITWGHVLCCLVFIMVILSLMACKQHDISSKLSQIGELSYHDDLSENENHVECYIYHID